MGEPHDVFRKCPSRITLLNPKSAIFTLLFASRSRFSGFKSRCTTMFRWQYSTPETICWKKCRASFSPSRPFSTM